MKKAVFISIAAFAAIYALEPMNKSLVKNRANYAEDNGGVYGNKMYIYKEAVETQREIYEQSRNRNSKIDITSPTIDKNSKVRGVEVLVEGGNLNIIGRKADVNIGSPTIQGNSGIKEINTAVDLNNINILANQNNTINIAAPKVIGNNPLTTINANANIHSINTAANQNVTANISSVDVASISSGANLSTNVTIDGAVKINGGTTVNVGAVNIGKPKNNNSSGINQIPNGAHDTQPIGKLPVLTNINTNSSGMAYTGEGTTNGGIDSRTGREIGNGVSINKTKTTSESTGFYIENFSKAAAGTGY